MKIHKWNITCQTHHTYACLVPVSFFLSSVRLYDTVFLQYPILWAKYTLDLVINVIGVRDWNSNPTSIICSSSWAISPRELRSSLSLGMEFCDVQIVSPCQATTYVFNEIRTTKKSGVLSATSPPAIRIVTDTIIFPSEQTIMYAAHIKLHVLANFENIIQKPTFQLNYPAYRRLLKAN